MGACGRHAVWCARGCLAAALVTAAPAQAADNDPCEVSQDGTVTATKGRAYGQQVSQLTACLLPGSVLDLTSPGCTLPTIQ